MELTDLAHALLRGSATDQEIAAWADRHTAPSYTRSALRDPALQEAARAHPERLLDHPQGVSLLFAFAPAQALLPLCRHALREPNAMQQLTDSAATLHPELPIPERIAERAAARLQALLKLAALDVLHRDVEPLLQQLASDLPMSFDALTP